MGRFRKPTTGGQNGPKNPADFTLKWNAGTGTFHSYEKDENGQNVNLNMKNVHGIILHPGLSKVTGRTKDGRVNLQSNYVENFVHDIYTVKSYTKTQDGTKVDTIAEGIWKDIKEAPIPQSCPKMRYTSCIVIQLLEANVSVYDKKTKKNSKFKTRKFEDTLAIIELRGQSIMTSEGFGNNRKVIPGCGWVGSWNAYNADADNKVDEKDTDGFYMFQNEVIELPKKEGEDGSWKQPGFLFKPPSELPSDVLDIAGELYKKFEAYLKEHWELGDDEFEDTESSDPGEDEMGSPDVDNGIGVKSGAKPKF